MHWSWIVLSGIVAVAVAVWLFRRRHNLRDWGVEFQAARARELFSLQRERLEGLFSKAAAASGKPRGLRWVECSFERDLVLAKERRTKALVGLVGVTIRFEAVEGGDMEGLAAVGNLRNATAVFVFSGGQWETIGKAVFNLNPPEVLLHFRNDYEPVTDASAPAMGNPNHASNGNA